MVIKELRASGMFKGITYSIIEKVFKVAYQNKKEEGIQGKVSKSNDAAALVVISFLLVLLITNYII